MTKIEADNYNRHFPSEPSSRNKYCNYCGIFVGYFMDSHIITANHRRKVEEYRHPILKRERAMTKHHAERTARLINKEDGLKATVIKTYNLDHAIEVYTYCNGPVIYEATISEHMPAMAFISGVHVGRKIEAAVEPMEINNDDD